MQCYTLLLLTKHVVPYHYKAGDIRGSTGVTVAQFLAASRAGPGSAIHSLSDGSGGLTAPRLPSGCSSTVYDFPAAGVGQNGEGSKPERCVRFAVAKDQVRVTCHYILFSFSHHSLYW
jgi:hypothetical protein